MSALADQQHSFVVEATDEDRPPNRKRRKLDKLTLEDIGLSALLAPMRVEHFLESHFRRRAVHIKGMGRDCKELLPSLDVEELAATTASEKVFVWVRAEECASSPEGCTDSSTGGGRIRSVELEDARSVATLYGAGHAVYCRAPSEVEQCLVEALLRDTGFGLPALRDVGCLSGRGEVEVFCARGGHCTSWHTDFQENFTVQIRGTKRWLLYPSTDTHPLRARSPHFTDDDLSVVEDQAKGRALCGDGPEPHVGKARCVIMKPGDLLYFPAGMYHQVESLDDHNLSINVSLMAPTWADVICGALRHAMLKTEQGRSRVATLDFVNTCGHMLTLARDALATIQPAQLAPLATANTFREQCDDDGDIVIDLDDYLATINPASDRPLKQRLLVNPLATMLWEHQFAPYTLRPKETCSHVAILHVLFGANELLSPAFRAHLFFPPALYEALRAALTAEVICVNRPPSRASTSRFSPSIWGKAVIERWPQLCLALCRLGFLLPSAS